MNFPVKGQTEQSLGPNLDWQKTYSGWEATWVGEAPDGGYVFYVPGADSLYYGLVSKASLTKIDSNGNTKWIKTFDPPFPENIQVTNDGYIYLTRNDSRDVSSTPLTINKLGANGNLQWTQPLINIIVEGKTLFIQTSDNGYAVKAQNHTSLFFIKTNAHGNLEWTKTLTGFDGNYSFSSLIQTHDGGYALAGSYSGQTNNGADFCILKLDAQGNLQWTKTFGGINEDNAHSLVQTNDDTYVLVGDTASFGAGGTDVLMVKIDTQGNLQWAHTYGGWGQSTLLQGQTDFKGKSIEDKSWSVSNLGASGDYANCLVQTNGGGLAFAGQTQWSIPSYYLIWLVKTDANGIEQWNRTFANFEGNPVYAVKTHWGVNSLIQASDGSFVMAGYSGGDNYYDRTSFIIKTKPASESQVNSTKETTTQQLTFQPITIQKDGNITPLTAPITKTGNQYTLNEDIHGSLIIEADNIVINGQNHLITGNGTLGTLFVRESRFGIDLSGTKNVVINDLSIDNFKIALLLDDATSVAASGLTLAHNRIAVSGSKVTELTFTQNRLNENKDSIQLVFCSNSKLSDNKLVNNGLSITNSTNPMVFSNEFSNCGLEISNSPNTLICGNSFHDCWGTATSIANSKDVVVAANNYSDVNLPLWIRGDTSGLCYLNNFFNSDPCLVSEETDQSGAKVSWDNGTLGNYWSDYLQQNPQGRTVDSVTWRTPYVVCNNSTDNHPLYKPVSADVAWPLRIP